MIVYPARDIHSFVMYYVNGKPRSSLLIESTDSMIHMCFGGKLFQGGKPVFQEIEGKHRLELNINCENWLKLRGENAPSTPLKNLDYMTQHTVKAVLWYKCVYMCVY